ncbi:uncharacterized protein LOC113772907 [Coffea eugenioides]|uniref:uncharacterized protein LOC113754495 n=1 Tax=Coffea eugenioides TaxID=49369 RepID=UPI000F604F2C|nr:uncharacterized protein LOC113754495 [Coffea eugenioides]XP_027173209.1 uncharacterized protein LOC113772907 [Coffea eugenioides]
MISQALSSSFLPSSITRPTSPFLPTHWILSSLSLHHYYPAAVSWASPATTTRFFMASALGGGGGGGSTSRGFWEWIRPSPGFYVSPFAVVCVLLGICVVNKKIFLWLVWNWFRAVVLGILAIALLDNPMTALISALAAIVAAIQLLLARSRRA